MPFIRVFTPQSQSELAVVTSLLEAHGIPVFVQNRHFGSLLPGLPIKALNAQCVMVPEERVPEAVELLAGFRDGQVD
jgi:Putative prokaryotic signal transducing protein